MSYMLSVILESGAVAVAGIAIAFVVHQRRLGKHRGVAREAFIGAFTDSAIPAEIASAVYDYYKRRAISKEFSVAPEDDYAGVLSEGDEDIDDDARFLIKRLGLKLPPNYAMARSEMPIRTLRDMVVWLHWVQQHQGV